MIFIDSNIPMYLVGAPHPNKERALRLLDQLIRERERLVTSAEVFQEILHRYAAIKRKEAIAPAYEVLTKLTDEIFPILTEDVFEAKNILVGQDMVSARDCLHVATMKRNQVSTIFSFDQGFDEFPGVSRIPSSK